MEDLKSLMIKPEENIADSLHAKARLALVTRLPIKERKKILKSIYGKDFEKVETFPLPESKQVISYILANWNPKKTDNPLVVEEYRRLERVLDYQRKTFCLDLEGLIIDKGQIIPGIEEAISKVRERHCVVISTAAPEQEAGDMLSKTKLKKILTFGNLGCSSGKNYGPIDNFFGYAHPEEHLVAIGHSFEDIPADIEIPFIYLDVEKDKLAQALLSGVDFIDGKKPSLRVIKKSLKLRNKKLDKFYIVF